MKGEEKNSKVPSSKPLHSKVLSHENLAGSSPSSTTSLRSDILNKWSKGIKTLQDGLDPQVFKAYISQLQLGQYDQERSLLRVVAPSRFVSQHITAHYKHFLTDCLSASFEQALTIELDIENQEDESPKSKYVVVKKVRSKASLSGSRQGARREEGEDSGLNPRYTFSNFVVGSGNQFCHAASRQVAENSGNVYNPLFIYGGVGLGKTHLLHAIGNAVLSSNNTNTSKKKRVLYLSSETFTNDLIFSLRHGKMDEFKKRIRNIDVLLIDDIQFMCGKERTQEEFFHTFNALYSAKHQIVITSDKIPQDIPGIEERLQTRFSWGLTADIQAPDFETRVAILERKASSENFVLSEEVAHFIAENVSSNVRELEGALTRLHALCSLQKVPMTKSLAESALRPILKKKKVHVTIADIQKVVAKHFGITVAEMVSKRRTKNLSFPRHVAMYLCRKHTTSSYPEIGSKFGGRDHSSVIHAANVVTAKVKDLEEIRAHIREIEETLLH